MRFDSSSFYLSSSSLMPAHLPQITVPEFKSKLKEIQKGETDVTTWTFGG